MKKKPSFIDKHFYTIVGYVFLGSTFAFSSGTLQHFIFSVCGLICFIKSLMQQLKK